MSKLVWVLLALSVTALAGCEGQPTQKPAFYNNLARSGAVLDREDARSTISLYRTNNDLSALALDERLNEVAQAYAHDLAAAAAKGRPIKPDGKLKERLTKAGLAGSKARENVSAGYHRFAEAFSGWRESKQHRATMLLTPANRMGIAAVYLPQTKYKVYWVLIVANSDQ